MIFLFSLSKVSDFCFVSVDLDFQILIRNLSSWYIFFCWALVAWFLGNLGSLLACTHAFDINLW